MEKYSVCHMSLGEKSQSLIFYFFPFFYSRIVYTFDCKINFSSKFSGPSTLITAMHLSL